MARVILPNWSEKILCLIYESNNEQNDYYFDEFTCAGLINSLEKCTKIFITDEADISLIDAGIFNGFQKPLNEMNWEIYNNKEPVIITWSRSTKS